MTKIMGIKQQVRLGKMTVNEGIKHLTLAGATEDCHALRWLKRQSSSVKQEEPAKKNKYKHNKLNK